MQPATSAMYRFIVAEIFFSVSQNRPLSDMPVAAAVIAGPA
jgi:hypothetical protein